MGNVVMTACCGTTEAFIKPTAGAKMDQLEDKEENGEFDPEEKPTADLEEVLQMVIEQYHLQEVCDKEKIAVTLMKSYGVATPGALRVLLMDEAYLPEMVQVFKSVATPTFHKLLLFELAKKSIMLRMSTILADASTTWITGAGIVKQEVAIKKLMVTIGHKIQYFQVFTEPGYVFYESKWGRATITFTIDESAKRFKSPSDFTFSSKKSGIVDGKLLCGGVKNGASVWKFIERNFFDFRDF